MSGFVLLLLIQIFILILTEYYSFDKVQQKIYYVLGSFIHYLDFVAENMSTYPGKTHGWEKLAGNLPISRPDVMQIAGEQL